jgi:CBS domain containing-hemolysin-like protein
MLDEITEINSQHTLSITEEVPETTVANWCMETLGRLPRTEEILTWQNLTIRVLRVVKQRVMEIKVIVDSNTEKNI